jgi:HSP20 family molecular chaperone IbpA
MSLPYTGLDPNSFFCPPVSERRTPDWMKAREVYPHKAAAPQGAGVAGVEFDSDDLRLLRELLTGKKTLASTVKRGEDGSYLVYIDVPGRTATDFVVQMENSPLTRKNIITITANRLETPTYRPPLKLGLEVPSDANADGVSMNYQAGVLGIVLPPATPPKPLARSIQVEAK